MQEKNTTINSLQLSAMTEYTDEQLLDLLQDNGSRETFSVIFSRYQNPMLAHAFYILKDVADAEEIVQEYFVNFWEKRKALHITTSLRAYLMVGIRNRCIDKLRRLKSRDKLNQHYLSLNLPQQSDNTSLESKELGLQIQQAIEELPKKARVVFNEHFLEGKPQAEVAGNLGIKVQSVRNRFSFSIKFLRKKLQNVH